MALEYELDYNVSVVIQLILKSRFVKLRRDQRRGAWLRASSSAHRFLHQRADPRLTGFSQLRQREGVRPHGAFVEVRLVAEAERRVPRLELLCTLEEADDVAVLIRIRGHPIPGFRREGWRAGGDDLMEPPGHGAIRFLHRSDCRKHVAFPFCLVLGGANLLLLT